MVSYYFNAPLRRCRISHIKPYKNLGSDACMYEIYIYIIISIIFESGGGMLYGVAVGFDPRLVFVTTLTINILTVFVSILLIDRLLEWRKGLRSWLEKRTARGQRIINKYAWIGIIIGMFMLSPLQ